MFSWPYEYPASNLSTTMSTSVALKVVQGISEMRSIRTALSDSVSLIPTMGLLHQGHLSLVRLAAEQTSSVIVSIYANPSQFASFESKDSYPSTLDSDIAALTVMDETFRREGLGRIKAVFAPTDEEMYPFARPTQLSRGEGSYLHILPLSNLLEGSINPTHFIGVATVCLKLFNIVKPHKAYFGEKDFQQTLVIKRLVLDFFLDITVVIGPTVRDADGMAMSSRNFFLGNRRRKVGVILRKALCVAESAYLKGERTMTSIMAPCIALVEEERDQQERRKKNERARFEIEYLALSDPQSLADIEVVDSGKGAIVSGAIRMLGVEEGFQNEDKGWHDGKEEIRLIDNLILKPIKV